MTSLNTTIFVPIHVTYTSEMNIIPINQLKDHYKLVNHYKSKMYESRRLCHRHTHTNTHIALY